MCSSDLTYAMITLRAAFYMGPEQLLLDVVFLRALTITVGWSLLTTLVSVGVVRWRSDV